MNSLRADSILRRGAGAFRFVCVSCLCFLAGMGFQTLRIHSESVEAASGHLYELMVYHAVPGKAPALESIFKDVSKLQAKHGLSALGYWVPKDDSPMWKDTFVYLVVHLDRQTAEANWNALHARSGLSSLPQGCNSLDSTKRWGLSSGRDLHATH